MEIQPVVQGSALKNDIGDVPAEVTHVEATERSVGAAEQRRMLSLVRQEKPRALVSPRGQNHPLDRQLPGALTLDMEVEGRNAAPVGCMDEAGDRGSQRDQKPWLRSQRRVVKALRPGDVAPPLQRVEPEAAVRLHVGKGRRKSRRARPQSADCPFQVGSEVIRRQRPGRQAEPGPFLKIDGIER